MIALVFSPLLVSLSVAVGIGLPGIGLYYELAYRRDRRRTAATSRACDSDVDISVRQQGTESA